MTVNNSPEIPDRTFIDDFGRRWEWCGGQPGTWAWRITDLGNAWMIAAVQNGLITTFNTLRAALLGPYVPALETSPVPDRDVAEMLADAAKRLPPCSRCAQPIQPGQWIVNQTDNGVAHMHCPEGDYIENRGGA